MSTEAAFWNTIARTYAEKPVENPEAFDRKIAITQALLSPQSHVLDIGCGTGSLALRLAPFAAEVKGLDISSEMVAIARDKAKDFPNVTFSVGAVDTLATLATESVDVVCAYSLLHLIPDLQGTLAEVFRILTPGGAIVASTVCLGDTWVPYRPLLWLMQQLGKAPQVSIVRSDAMVRDLRAAGFCEVRRHDTGSKPTTVFTVAKKPPAS